MLHLCDRSSFRRPLIGVLGRARPPRPSHGILAALLQQPQHKHYGQGERDTETEVVVTVA